MSDHSQDPAPKKRVVRSRVAASAGASAPARPTGAAVPGPKSVEAAPSPAKSPGEGPASPAVGPKAADAPANAALALAVMSARREAGSAPAEAPPAAPTSATPGVTALMRRPVAQAAALAVAVAAGWFGADALATTRPDGQAGTAQWTETAQALRQGQQDVVRLTGDIKALKVAIESLKESVDRSKSDLMAKQAQVMERVERPPGDAARLAKLAEQLDRVEATAKEPTARFAALTERFDRLERQITTLQTAAAKPAAPAPVPAADGPIQTGSLEAKPAVKEPPRDVPLEGWVLHEVYDGVALIEGRNRRLYEVGLGGVIPGVGPVEAIERRGKRWVVVTQKGFIGNER